MATLYHQLLLPRYRQGFNNKYRTFTSETEGNNSKKRYLKTGTCALAWHHKNNYKNQCNQNISWMRVRLYFLVNDLRCHWSFHFILNCKHAVQCDVLFDNTAESRLLGLVESTKEHAWVLIDGTDLLKDGFCAWTKPVVFVAVLSCIIYYRCLFVVSSPVCAFRCKFSVKNCALKTSVFSRFVESLFIHIEGWPLLLMTCH